MFTKSKLAKSVAIAMAFGTMSSLSLTSTAFAQEGADEAEEVEKISITGSRIQRADLEGALPVTVIDREQLEFSGEISVADALRNTTFNSFGSFRPQSGSSAQGTSSLDLRGLGAGRTLVLVDGKRLSVSPSTGASQDLNGIPLSAVERIEILSDGASAIYGSDAIGGVVNVILRRDFTGVELSIGEGRISIPSEGGDRENGSVVIGAANDTTSVIAGVNWNRRDIIFARAFPWNEPGVTSFGNNWDGPGIAGRLAIPGGCEQGAFYDLGATCAFDFTTVSADEASTGNESAFFKARHEINDDWELYNTVTIGKTESFGRYAPTLDGQELGGIPDISAGSFNNPTNPNAWFYDANNPFAVPYDPTFGGRFEDGYDNQPVFMRHRFAAMGSRDTTVNNENIDFLLGAEGNIGDWFVDFGIRRVRNTTVELGTGYLARRNAWANIENFNPGYEPLADGTFNFDNFNPDLYRTGYDLQRPLDNPEDVLQDGRISISRDSKFDFDEVFVSVSGELPLELDGGYVGVSVGAERREESYADIYDAQSEAGNVGGSAGNSAGGGRDVNAYFFEALFPVLEDLEISVAGRYDDYSDFGGEFSPKVSVRYQPTDELVLRASYGEGFRAPTLDILTQKPSFSADSVIDPVTCGDLNGPENADEPCQINGLVIANPDLGPELSEQYSVGVAYSPVDWFGFNVDYYNIEVTNEIRNIGAQALLNREANGIPLPAGLQIIRDGNGIITQIIRGAGNESGGVEVNGVDFDANVTFDFEDMGSINSTFYVSYINEYLIDGVDQMGFDGQPNMRANWVNQYSIGDFDIAYNINLIGKQDEDPDEEDQRATYVTHDLQVVYTTPWNGRFAIGAQNLFEKEPELKPFGSRDYNFNLYDAYGRITYFRYTQKF